MEKATKDDISTHPYNDLTQWIGADFSTAPLNEDWVKKFQKKIDRAFGLNAEGKSAIILAWSGDQRYWNSFYTDWYGNGLPKQSSLERQPRLLFGRFNINEFDYYDVIAPRWILLERMEYAQYAPSWKDSSWVYDGKMDCNKMARPDDPPREYFEWMQTLAIHETPINKGYVSPCCRRARLATKKCYGLYRPPNEKDIEELRAFRQWREKNNLQRADEAFNAETLKKISENTQFSFQQAEIRKSKAMREFVMTNPTQFLGSFMKDRDIQMSTREIDEAASEALDIIEVEKMKKYD